jgi:CMP-N-acetylneuraminic acid synthetase
LIDRVVVSTDSDEIAAAGRKYGAEVPFRRPDSLAGDQAAKLPVIKHAVEYYSAELRFRPDYVIDMDPTSPLRLGTDIEGCLRLVMNDPECDSVITGYRSNKNPYFNMVELDPHSFAGLSKRPARPVSGRQEAPVVYAMNASIYAWKTDVLMKQEQVVSGRVRFFEMPEERSIDIDSEIDFTLVELFLKQRRSA